MTKRPLQLALALAVLAGCNPGTPEKPADPSLATVTLEVRGMT